MALKQVVVELLADTRSVLSGLKKTSKQTDVTRRAFRRLGATMAGIFSARAMFRFFDRTIDSTNALIKTAKGVGFTVDEYQQLTFALSQVGVEAGSAKIAIGDFQKRLSKAVAGTSPQFAKAFKEAGLDIKALSKMGPAEAFNAAFQHLAGRINDPRIAGLFGNVFEEQSGKDMLKAARQVGVYTKSWEDYARTVEPLSKEEEKRFEDIQYQTGLMTLQWGRLKQKIVADAAPKIMEALKALDESGALKQMAEGITEAIRLTGLLVQKFAEVQKASGSFFKPDDGLTPEERTEMSKANAIQKRLGSNATFRPGLLNPMTQAQYDYSNRSITQHNKIVVQDGDQAKATKKLLQKERRLGTLHWE